MRTARFALLFAGSLLALPAGAQIGLSPVQDYINKTTLLNNILSNQRATGMSQRAQTGASSSTGRSSTSTATLSPTQFRHAGQPLVPKMLAQRAGGGASQQQEAERFFQSMLDLYDRTAQNDGFPANDVAYAMEYFVVNGYMVYHDLHDVPYEKDPRVRKGQGSFDRLQILAEKKALKPTLTDERAVYTQIQSTLASNPEVQKMSDRQKQELTEVLAIMLGVNYSAYMKGVNAEDERLLAQARESAKENLEKLIGVPIAKIRIDASGLRQ
jgi:hypothetical protein